MRIKAKRVVVLTIGLCFILAFSLTYMGPTTARRGPRTIFVDPPHPDPAVNRMNIQDAFDEATEHRGWKVRLRAGTYVIDQPIDIANFDGTFKGAGKDKTVIQNMDGFHVHPEYGHPVLFLFYQDTTTESTADDPYTIRIEGLTIELVGGSEPWGLGWTAIGTGIQIMGVQTEFWDPAISYFDVFIKHVGFIGQPDPEGAFGYNGAFGIWIHGQEELPDAPDLLKRVQGTYSVTHCTFEHFAYCLNFAGFYENSKILISHNTFDDVRECFYCRDTSNSFVKVSHNTGTNIHEDAVFINNGVAHTWLDAGSYGLPYPEISKFIISHNYFSSDLVTEADIIMVVDWGYGGGGDSTIKAYICFNEIYLDDATGGAIFTSWLYDSWIVSNTISGHGFMGIYIGFWAHH